MGRRQVATDDGEDVIEACDRCGYLLAGVANCGYCGEPRCPVCGCYCATDEADVDSLW
jgi:hypothetical protein